MALGISVPKMWAGVRLHCGACAVLLAAAGAQGWNWRQARVQCTRLPSMQTPACALLKLPAGLMGRIIGTGPADKLLQNAVLLQPQVGLAGLQRLQRQHYLLCSSGLSRACWRRMMRSLLCSVSAASACQESCLNGCGTPALLRQLGCQRPGPHR